MTTTFTVLTVAGTSVSKLLTVTLSGAASRVPVAIPTMFPKSFEIDSPPGTSISLHFPAPENLGPLPSTELPVPPLRWALAAPSSRETPSVRKY